MSIKESIEIKHQCGRTETVYIEGPFPAAVIVDDKVFVVDWEAEQFVEVVSYVYRRGCE